MTYTNHGWPPPTRVGGYDPLFSKKKKKKGTHTKCLELSQQVNIKGGGDSCEWG